MLIVAGGGLDIPNRIVDSPERTPEVQLEQDDIEAPFIAEANPNWRGASPVRTTVGPNRNAEEDVDGGGLDNPNRTVDSSERMTEVQLEQESTAICQVHAAKGGHPNRTVDSPERMTEVQLEQESTVICQSEQQLTPHQIWDFMEQIGVRGKTNLEDMVRRIVDMEQRDWEAFQQFASVGKQNEAGRGLVL
ncbi:hypothetical protein Ancab_019647 [Ancistrocladus abbreviatus]